MPGARTVLVGLPGARLLLLHARAGVVTDTVPEQPVELRPLGVGELDGEVVRAHERLPPARARVRRQRLAGDDPWRRVHLHDGLAWLVARQHVSHAVTA